MVPFWGGYCFHCRNQKFRVFSNSKIFKKCLKNQRKISNFLKILRKFCDFLKILSQFSQKCREKFRKFSKYGLVGGSGADPPEASENIKIISPKINGNQQNFENFHEFFSEF